MASEQLPPLAFCHCWHISLLRCGILASIDDPTRTYAEDANRQPSNLQGFNAAMNTYCCLNAEENFNMVDILRKGVLHKWSIVASIKYAPKVLPF